MKISILKSWKLWQRLALLAVLSVVLFTGLLTMIVYLKQDQLVQAEVDAMNKTHQGRLVVGNAHVALFRNFPYFSVKVDDVSIYESKEDSAAVILEVDQRILFSCRCGGSHR
jgi:hypothetical protein